MPFFVLYAAAFGGATLLCFAGAARALRITGPGVRRSMTALLLTSGAWAATDLGLLLLSGTAWAEAVHIAGLVSGLATVWAWVYFCSAYSRRALHRSRAVHVGAGIFFAFVVALKVTNPLHGLYFALEPARQPFPHVAVRPRLLYWLVNALAYALAAGGYALLVPAVLKTEVGRGPIAGLVGLTGLPVLLNAAGSTTPYLLQINHDALGVAAFATGALFVYKRYFTDAYRLGRDRPAVIVGEAGRVRSYNAAMQRAFPRFRQPGVEGEAIEDVLPGIESALDSPAALFEANAQKANARKANARKANARKANARKASAQKEAVLQGRAGEGSGALDRENGRGEGGTAGRGRAGRYFQVAESRFGAGLDQPGRLLVLTDVTEREKRSRDRDALLQSLIASLPGMVFRLRAGGGQGPRLSYLSASARRILGVDPNGDDLLETCARRVPPGDRLRVLRSLREATREGERFGFEIPIRRRSGDRRWLLGMAVPEDGAARSSTAPEARAEEEEVSFAGVCIDITRRKDAEKDLRRSERRFRAIAEQAVDVIAVLGLDGTIRYLSPSAERVTGRRREELRGADVFQLADPGDEVALRSAFLQAVSHPGEPVETEGRIRRPDGEKRLMSVRARRITGPGEETQVVANIRDVTDARRRQQQLVEAKEEAEEAARLKSAMLANMSHEVRTPLTSIIGFAEILEGADLGDPHDRFVRLIKGSGERLLETLDAMLDLSTLESGAADLDLEAVAVGRLAEAVAREHARKAREGGVDLSVDTPEEPLQIRSDESALRRVLTNVVGNAVKFTGAGGAVEVRARHGQGPAASDREEAGEEAGPGAVIEVEDTGVGMDPSFAEEKAAEPFKQESTGEQREFEGSGLGLSIADRFAQLLGGRLSIDTAKGEGTRVAVRLPADPEAQASKAQASKAQASKAQASKAQASKAQASEVQGEEAQGEEAQAPKARGEGARAGRGR
jgi:PAS domain S-box-containing protein